MSFPGSFPSQLTAIMEALLKAVVAEVTALVEDGAVDLRLELRDREREILDKEREVEERDREIEERDRVIEELRDAVEELMARGDAAMSPAEEEEDRPEQTGSSEQDEWSKEDEDTKPIVKSEPTQEFTAASPDPHASLWPPPPLSSTNEDTAAACSYDESHTYNSQEATGEFSHLGPADLPLDSLLDMNQQHFYPAQQHGFAPIPNSSRGTKQKGLNAKQRKLAAFRCDQCGKAFTEKRRLVTHQSVHTGAKPYSCRKCGKKFSRRDNCVRHEKSDVRCKDSPVKLNEGRGLMQELNLAAAVPNCSHFN